MSSPEPSETPVVQLSPPPDERIRRIVAGLIERTQARAITWEHGAPPDSWAVTVALTRFRVTGQDGQTPYSLDIFGEGEAFRFTTGSDEAWNAMLSRLYEVGRESTLANTADPLRSVEEQLGLS
jgi:hypothetical protein